MQDTSIWDLMEIILRRIKQISVPNNGASTASPPSSASIAPPTTMSTSGITSAGGHRETFSIEEIKHELFVNDRGRHRGGGGGESEVLLLFARIVRILAKTLQATTATETNWTYDQSWLAIMCTSPSIVKRHVAIARLKNPCNFGRNCQEARFIVFILSPTREKGTKNFLETGRTFATIFADIELRAKLLKASNEKEFISIIDVSSNRCLFIDLRLGIFS